jgi:hypothetical protein
MAFGLAAIPAQFPKGMRQSASCLHAQSVAIEAIVNFAWGFCIVLGVLLVFQVGNYYGQVKLYRSEHVRELDAFSREYPWEPADLRRLQNTAERLCGTHVRIRLRYRWIVECATTCKIVREQVRARHSVRLWRIVVEGDTRAELTGRRGPDDGYNCLSGGCRHARP